MENIVKMITLIICMLLFIFFIGGISIAPTINFIMNIVDLIKFHRKYKSDNKLIYYLTLLCNSFFALCAGGFTIYTIYFSDM